MMDDIHKSILRLAGCITNEVGDIYEYTGLGIMPDEPVTDEMLKQYYVPLIIDGLVVVLPTEEAISSQVVFQNDTPTKSMMLFTPFKEEALLIETPLVTYIRSRTTMFLNRYIHIALKGVLRYLSTPSMQQSNILPTTMLKIVSAISTLRINNTVDSKSMSNLDTINNRWVKNTGYGPYIHLLIGRGAVIGDDDYRRVTEVTYPYNEIVLGNEDIKPLRIKDRAVFRVIYNYISDVPFMSGGLTGSNSSEYPTMDSFINAVLLVLDRIYSIIDAFTESTDFVPSGSYLDTLRNLDANASEIMSALMLIPNTNTLPSHTNEISTVDNTDKISAEQILNLGRF